MQPWHIRLSSDGRHPMFPTEARRRAALHTLARIAGGELVLFCLVDDHAHIVLFCERALTTVRARGLSRTLRRLAAVPLERSFTKPVDSRHHMQWLVRYLLEQPARHRLAEHHALWTGSCFADLVGARALPGLTLRIASALPRFSLPEACRIVGLRKEDRRPLPPAEVRQLGASRVVAAATFVLAADPDLSDQAAPAVAARALAARVGRAAGITRRELGWVLRRSDRQMARAEAIPLDPALERALRVRLAIEEAVGRPRGA